MSDEQRRVISLEDREWMAREELAEHLDVSPRTMTAMIQRGDVERRDGPDGPRYRYAVVEAPVVRAAAPADPVISPGRLVEGPTELVRIPLREWTGTKEALAATEVRLQAAQQDVRRAVEYAQVLEEELERAERAHRELTEELHTGRGVLSEMLRQRARFHLEAGRREQAEQALRQRDEELRELQYQVEALQQALQKAQDRGLSAGIGPLRMEIKL
jgi:hypothetical protein